MQISYFQVNAFTNKFNGGNPAGVCPLQEWLPEDTMQAIARENNLSETAFFVKKGQQYELRWFTPSVEVDLCGHATLATAHVLFSEMQYQEASITFNTKSGQLVVTRQDDNYVMDMPAIQAKPTDVPDNLVKGLGRVPLESYRADDYMLVYDDADFIRELQPDYALVEDIERRGTIITAPANEEGVDFVSRFFGSAAVGIKEDPATGSAHCMLAPYWGKRLAKNRLAAKQLSSRGATIVCQPQENRVLVAGRAVTYIKGTICM